MEIQPQNPEFRINPENFKIAICLQNRKKSNSTGQMSLDKLKINQRSQYNILNSVF